jgi:hypothetical protein
VKRILERLTYANVMSSIAVFLVIGGATAFAALGRNSVGAKQLKKNAVTAAKIRKNAVTTQKIKDHAVTAAKLNLSGLGTVPNAVNAQTATNANTVNGQSQTKVFKTLNAGQSGVEVATVAGFTIRATCEAEDIDVVLSSPSSSGSALLAEGEGRNEGSVFQYDSQAAGTASEVRLDGPSAADNRYGETTFSGATDGGTVVSGDIAYDFSSFGEKPPGICVVFGELASG